MNLIIKRLPKFRTGQTIYATLTELQGDKVIERWCHGRIVSLIGRVEVREEQLDYLYVSSYVLYRYTVEEQDGTRHYNVPESHIEKLERESDESLRI